MIVDIIVINVGKTMPFARNPQSSPFLYIGGMYVYHSQSWVVYGLVLPHLFLEASWEMLGNHWSSRDHLLVP